MGTIAAFMLPILPVLDVVTKVTVGIARSACANGCNSSISHDGMTLLFQLLNSSGPWVPLWANVLRSHQARQAVRRLRTVATVVMSSSAHFRNPEHRDLFLSDLRLAARESG